MGERTLDMGTGREAPAAHRLCSDMPGATYFCQRSNKGVEIDTVHPQIGEGLKHFQITEFLGLLLLFSSACHAALLRALHRFF